MVGSCQRMCRDRKDMAVVPTILTRHVVVNLSYVS